MLADHVFKDCPACRPKEKDEARAKHLQDGVELWSSETESWEADIWASLSVDHKSSCMLKIYMGSDLSDYVFVPFIMLFI